MSVIGSYLQGRSLTIDRTIAGDVPDAIFENSKAGNEDAISRADQNVDQLTLSPEAEARLAGSRTDTEDSGESELTPEEEEQVQKLAERDREVRTHEQAHVAAAGPYARGGPTYSYQKGPDGRNYAIGGEVQIDTAPVSGDPEATIQKARVVKAAALAPAEPSSQDQAVAAAATQMEMQARSEQAQQRLEKQNPDAADATSVSDPRKGSLNILA